MHDNLASEVVSSLEEALDVHECLVTLRALSSQRSEAQSRAMPMEVRRSFLLSLEPLTDEDALVSPPSTSTQVSM